MSWAHDVWGDGANRLFVAGGGDGLFELQRGGPALRHRPLGTVSKLDGRGAGEGVELVVSDGNSVARYRANQWSVLRLPDLSCGFGCSRVEDVAMGGDGSIFVALAEGGLLTWSPNNAVQVLSYPSAFEAEQVVVTREQRVFVRSRFTVLERTANALSPAFFAPQVSGADARLGLLWQHPTTQQLWLGASGTLWEISLANNTVRRHAFSLFGRLNAVASVRAGTERLLLAAQSDLAFWEQDRTLRLSAEVVFCEGLYTDEVLGHVYSVNRRGIRRFRLTDIELPLRR